MRGAFGQQRNHNKEENILNISLLLRFVYLLRTNRNRPYHTTRTVPSHTVPIHTNTVHTYIPIWTASTFFFSFFSSSLLFLSPPSCLSFFCNLSLCRSLSQTLPSSLSYPLLPLHSPPPNPLSLTWRLRLSSRPSGRIVRPF